MWTWKGDLKIWSGKCPVSSEVAELTAPRTIFENFLIFKQRLDARSYPVRVKRAILITVSSAALHAPMGSAIIYPVLTDVTQAFDVAPVVINLSISLFLVAVGIAPLFWSSMGEIHGRRLVYISSFFVYTFSSFCCAFSPNAAMFISFRVIQAIGCSSVQRYYCIAVPYTNMKSTGAATLADLFPPAERGRAMPILLLGPQLGPLLSPLIGGALHLRFSWRSTMCFLGITGALQTLALILLVPETLSTVLEEGTEKYSLINTALHIWKRTVSSFGLLKAPKISAAVLYASIVYGSLYCMQLSMSHDFSSRPYNFSSILVGCTFLANAAGYIIGSFIGGYYSDRVYNRYEQRLGKKPPAECRVLSAIPGAILVPAGLLIFGWTIEKLAPRWYYPICGVFLLGLGMLLAFGTITTYLVDASLNRPSAVIAVNNGLRSIFAAVGSEATLPLQNAITVEYFYTGLAGICILGILLLVYICRRIE